MRADIVPGGTFPDYELTDHTKIRRRLSELQGIDPMILVLSRGGFCPRTTSSISSWPRTTRRSASPTRRSSPSRPTTSSRPTSSELGRRAVDLPVRRQPQDRQAPRHRRVHRLLLRPDDPVHARAQTGAGHTQHLQRLLVLGQALVRGSPPRSARGDPRNPPGLGPGRTRPPRELGGRRPLDAPPLPASRPQPEDGVRQGLPKSWSISARG